MKPYPHSPAARLGQPPSEAGASIGGCRVQALLTEDPGWCTQYRVKGPRGEDAALKLVPANLVHSHAHRRRFRRLARRRASLEHPNLLPVVASGECEHGLFIALRLVNVPTLEDLIEVGGLDVRATVRLLWQVADALEAAHAHGLVHRELAPSSILVDPHDGGRALLADFGIARPELLTREIALLASPSYLSPEEIREEPVGLRSSVYSLACMLHACLTGEDPYAGMPHQAVVYAHVAEPPPRPTHVSPHLPADFDAVIARGMAKQPEGRYASPRELMRAAAQVLHAEIPGPAPITTPAHVSVNGANGSLTAADSPLSDLVRGATRTVGGRGAQASRTLRVVGSSLVGSLRDRVAVPRMGFRTALGQRMAALWALATRSLTTVGRRAPHATGAPRPRVAGRVQPLRGRRRATFFLTVVLPVLLAGIAGYVVGNDGGSESGGAGVTAASPAKAAHAAQAQRAALGTLAATLERLDRRRVEGRRRIAAARTRGGQASEARRMARAYESAAREVRGLPSPPALPGALARVAQSYRRLAASALRGQGSAFVRARRQVRRSEAAAEGLVRELAES